MLRLQPKMVDREEGDKDSMTVSIGTLDDQDTWIPLESREVGKHTINIWKEYGDIGKNKLKKGAKNEKYDKDDKESKEPEYITADMRPTIFVVYHLNHNELIGKMTYLSS